MKTESRQLSLSIFIPVLLLINFVILLLLCFIKGQLQVSVFFSYMYYASFVNIGAGTACLMGSMQSRQDNLGVNYNVYPRKTSDEMLSEQRNNWSKSLTFTIGLVSVGTVLLILSILFR
ncbi:hypothetical protein NBE98_17930 [Clostridium swellfunianum]|uniref:hypothetical protein n=1 Tax=Clostridium swellfunianum TaxID=1367462 RepID=UPI00202E29AE|nr:hypothetical protein [Clostridium swellfunianum]MCM0650248.1 hypothetical protein [Clostridium swellfunianum]